MDVGLILTGRATLEDLYELNLRMGVEFVVSDGQIMEVIF